MFQPKAFSPWQKQVTVLVSIHSPPFSLSVKFGVMLRTQANQMFLKKANILVVMVNVDFQLDSVWNHLGCKPMGTPIGDDQESASLCPCL